MHPRSTSRRDELVVLCELRLVRRRLLWEKVREGFDCCRELWRRLDQSRRSRRERCSGDCQSVSPDKP